VKSEPSVNQIAERINMASRSSLRWISTTLAVITGAINFYYGNTYAGFYENLWYVMGGIYIFAAIVLAANVMPNFVQPTIFGYALFLLSLWAVGALLTGAGLDTVAFVDKAVEVLLAVNIGLLIHRSRPQ
jgi:hypothetical protein